MIIQLHQAAQYLAAAGISFVKAEDDDSHTNLDWDSSSHKLLTHPFLPSNFQLSLNFDTLALEWLKNGLVQSIISLESNTHAEILIWINFQVENTDIVGKYKYKFHYNLPYDDLSNSNVFKFDHNKVKIISNYLDTAQLKLIEFLKKHQLKSPIRIWPHHFDLGIYTEINKEHNLFLGAGYAIPDSWINDFYYYATGWQSNRPISDADFSTLSEGIWHQKENKGLTYSQNSSSNSGITIFLEEVLKGYKDSMLKS